MAARSLYIVSFQEAVDKFRRIVSDPELPTIDTDFVLHRVMTMFVQTDPFEFLKRLSLDLVEGNRLFTSGDYLYESYESFAISPDDVNEEETFVRDYLREAIYDLGRDLCQTLRSTGLLLTYKERYRIAGRPITDDTYLFELTRS